MTQSHNKPLLIELIRLMRPRQWTKNILLFAGIVFSHQFTDPKMLAVSTMAFAICCCLSAAVYIINDLMDREADKLHPVKRNRPLAAGTVSTFSAIVLAVFLVLAGLLSAFSLPNGFSLQNPFGQTALCYFAITCLYSLWIKRVAMADIILLALGFVLRAMAGVFVLRGLQPDIPITPWFILCVFFLALFVVTCKRRNELLSMHDEAASHRRVLEDYTPDILNLLIAVCTACTLLAYALYLTTEIDKGSIDIRMAATFPFVLYGIFRYIHLVYKKSEGGEPETLILKDKPLLLNTMIWLVLVVLLYKN